MIATAQTVCSQTRNLQPEAHSPREQYLRESLVVQKEIPVAIQRITVRREAHNMRFMTLESYSLEYSQPREAPVTTP
jgi:hypothetical protein